MLKRYKPSQPDGTETKFDLPDAYSGGIVTVFVNGQMLHSQGDSDSPFGYDLNEDDKYIEFYVALLEDDFLYFLYDDDGSGDSGSDYSGTGLMRLNKGFNTISYQGLKEAYWDKDDHEVKYEEGILANVQNLIIDQIEDIYDCPASNIIRELGTYESDTGKYRVFNTSSTSPCWCGDGEHVTNSDLYKEEDGSIYEHGDPDDDNYIAYNPNNFILSNCYINSDDDFVSLDQDNNLDDLPSGLRTGWSIYIHDASELDDTNGLLEIWF
jgi:hypothetical protein